MHLRRLIVMLVVCTTLLALLPGATAQDEKGQRWYCGSDFFGDISTVGGWIWQFVESGGYIDDANNGTVFDAYDGANIMSINGSNCADGLGGQWDPITRTMTTDAYLINGVSVVREVYFPDLPDTEFAWFRTKEIFTNPSVDTPVVFTYSNYSNLGSDGDGAIHATSSGDTVVATDDRWWVQDDVEDGTVDPALSWNVYGPGATLTPTSYDVDQGDVRWTYTDINLAADETIILMHFGGVSQFRADAAALAPALETDSCALLVGVDMAEMALIANWSLGAIDYAACDDSYETPFETPLTVDAPGVLGNDLDATGATAASGATAEGGTYALIADGSFSYTPPFNFSGTDSFTYESTDGVTTEMATAYINVDFPAPYVYTHQFLPDQLYDFYTVDLVQDMVYSLAFACVQASGFYQPDQRLYSWILEPDANLLEDSAVEDEGVDCNTGFDYDPFTAPVTGTYTLIVGEDFANPALADYLLQVYEGDPGFIDRVSQVPVSRSDLVALNQRAPGDVLFSVIGTAPEKSVGHTISLEADDIMTYAFFCDHETYASVFAMVLNADGQILSEYDNGTPCDFEEVTFVAPEDGVYWVYSSISFSEYLAFIDDRSLLPIPDYETQFWISAPYRFGEYATSVDVNLTPSQSIAGLGESVTLTATVRNAGVVDTTNVNLTFDIAPGLTVNSVTGCASLANCAIGELLVGAEATVEISTTVNSAISGNTAYSTATVSHSTIDPSFGDDTDFANVIIPSMPERLYPADRSHIISTVDGEQFQFAALDGAEWYNVWIGNADGTMVYEWYEGAEICSGDVCSIPNTNLLTNGDYDWWMTYWGPQLELFNSYWNMTYFSIDINAPSANFVHITPTGTVDEAPSSVTWLRDPSTLWYQVWVGSADYTSTYGTGWYNATDICGPVNCTVDLDSTLPDGEYEWWMEAWGPGGYVTWLDASNNPNAFTVMAGPVMTEEAFGR